jgi:polyisoprenoid-binding protein YceI
MKKHIVALTLASLLALSSPLIAAEYAIDTKGSHASINFKIPHLGYSILTGRFNGFEGGFSYDKDKPEDSKVSVTIDTTSIDSNHAERDKHLRSPDFLDTEMFPEATFVSTSFTPGEGENAVMVGDLTLHGVTKSLTFEVTHIGGGKDPWGGFRHGFSATTELVLADFEISMDLGPASKAVSLSIEVEGILQK